ncbi:hypothetical protein [Wandonia haliotis]
MEKFWLLIGIAMLLFITVLGFKEGFDRWAPYYVFPGIAFFAWIIRSFMRKRMEKHIEFLEQQKNKEEQ